MKREDIDKLLGGYATNTLTEQERRALFEAALSDQALFDALAREEAFKEVLEDLRCRREIEQALREQPQGLLARLSGWMRRPQAWALAGTLAATTVIAVAVIRVDRSARAPIQLAKQNTVPAAAPVPSLAQSHDEAQPPREESRIARQLPAPAKARQFTPPAETAPKGAERVAALEPPPAPAPAAPADKPAAVATAMTGGVASAPAPPPRFAAEQPAGTADKDKLATRYSTAQSIVVTAETPVVEAESKALGAVAKRELQRPLDLQYKIFAKGPSGQFAETDAKAQQTQGAQFRVVFTANQEGYLYVSGAHGVLFSTRTLPGVSYTVDPTPQDRRLTAVLSRNPVTAPPSYRALLRDSRAKETSDPKARLVIEVDLSRQYAQ